MNLDQLPQDCFAYIFSFTSPRDACRIAPVSSTIRSAADSDNVWEKFLPLNCQQSLPRLLYPVAYSSKKELFLRLCNPQLMDGGKKMFALDKSTGKKHYILGARELKITWADNPLYWTWKPLLQSRFSEVAELRTICWLEISGKINTGILSPRTVYAAYLIVKFADRAYGLDTLPSEVSLQVGDYMKLKSTVFLRRHESKKQADVKRMRAPMSSRVSEGEVILPCEGREGWVEIELGRFYTGGGDDDQEVKISLKEVTGEHLKGGLIVEAMELRPKS